MQASDIPGKISKAFAAGGGRNTIPVPSQIGITPGRASYTDGFPPLTRQPLSTGGIPPFGLDMNGILYDVSAWCSWDSAGGQAPYSSAFAALIGGYPSGAVVQAADRTGWWRCTADNNSTDPDAGGANWLPHFFYGLATQILAAANVTLTALQYSKRLITLSGTITANVNLVFPDGVVGDWIVVNNTTGAFTITAKTVSGTGIALGAGASLIYSDGTNMLLAVSAANQANQGTFTPTLQFGGGATGLTYSGQFGSYVQTGKLIQFFANIALSAKGSSTGAATFRLGTLPVASGLDYPAPMQIFAFNSIAAAGVPMALVRNGVSGGDIRYLAGASGTYANSLDDTYFTNTSSMIISGQYLKV